VSLSRIRNHIELVSHIEYRWNGKEKTVDGNR
jgi:hypothetical protein